MDHGMDTPQTLGLDDGDELFQLITISLRDTDIIIIHTTNYLVFMVIVL